MLGRVGGRMSCILFALAACGCDGGTEPSELAGTYLLVLFNDKSLPVTEAYPDGEEFTVFSGSLTLQNPDRFAMSFALHLEGVQETFTTHGMFIAGAGSIRLFTEDDFFDCEGSVAGGRVRLIPIIPSDDSDSEVLHSFAFEK